MIYEEAGLGNELLAGSIGSIHIMVIITWNELGGSPERGNHGIEQRQDRHNALVRCISLSTIIFIYFGASYPGMTHLEPTSLVLGLRTVVGMGESNESDLLANACELDPPELQGKAGAKGAQSRYCSASRIITIT